ncbi:MAG: AEC family transporter [Alphaproteobacteria bacterium]
MQAVFDIVLPVFGLILLGYGVARTPLLDEAGIKGLNNFVFYVAIPVLLFRSMSQLSIPVTADLLMPVAYFSAVAIVFSGGLVIARKVFALPLDEAAIMAMGCSYSNLLLLGLPLAFLAFGDDGLLAILLIISFHPLILVTLTTGIIELARGHRERGGRVLLSSLGALLRNPVIVGMAAGLLWGASGLGLPTPVASMADLLKAAASPTALFAVGASLTNFKIRGDMAQSLTITTIKLLVFPGLVWVMCTQVFGVGPLWTAVATLAAAMPTGVNTFLLASAYNTYLARSATVILISTALSVLTVGALIAILGPVR